MCTDSTAATVFTGALLYAMCTESTAATVFTVALEPVVFTDSTAATVFTLDLAPVVFTDARPFVYATVLVGFTLSFTAACRYPFPFGIFRGFRSCSLLYSRYPFSFGIFRGFRSCSRLYIYQGNFSPCELLLVMFKHYHRLHLR